MTGPRNRVGVTPLRASFSLKHNPTRTRHPTLTVPAGCARPRAAASTTASPIRPRGTRERGAPREARRLHYTPRLYEVILLVHHNDAIGIHEAVRDEGNHRGRNGDALQIEPAGRFHKMEEPALLLDEARNDPRGDV